MANDRVVIRRNGKLISFPKPKNWEDYSKKEKENKIQKEETKEKDQNNKEQKNDDYDYELYKKAIDNPDSIDPMTENSTDWEELDKKYKDKYLKEKIGNDVEKLHKYAKEEGILPSELQDRLGITDSQLRLKDEYTENFEKEMQGMERYLMAEEAKKSTKANNNERLIDNMIVSHYGDDVAYRDKNNNLLVTSRERYNNYVNGKEDRLGGQLALSDDEALKTMIANEGLKRYPYEGATRDEMTGNDKKYKEFKESEYEKLKGRVVDTTNARSERAKTNKNYSKYNVDQDKTDEKYLDTAKKDTKKANETIDEVKLEIKPKKETKTFKLRTQTYFGGNDLGEWEGKDFNEARENFYKENPRYKSGDFGIVTGSEVKSEKARQDAISGIPGSNLSGNIYNKKAVKEVKEKRDKKQNKEDARKEIEFNTRRSPNYSKYDEEIDQNIKMVNDNKKLSASQLAQKELEDYKDKLKNPKKSKVDKQGILKRILGRRK